jgi:hypothetical protein
VSRLDGALAIAEALNYQRAADRVWGTVRAFGEWFGGKPLDNLYTIADARSEGDALTVEFEAGETLVVVGPRGGYRYELAVTGLSCTSLAIQSFESLTWSWNLHGARIAAENRRTLTYRQSGSEVDVASTWDGSTRRLLADRPFVAVELVRPHLPIVYVEELHE